MYYIASFWSFTDLDKVCKSENFMLSTTKMADKIILDVIFGNKYSSAFRRINPTVVSYGMP